MRWSNDIWARATHTYMAPVSAWRTACEHSIKQCTAAWGLGHGTFGGLGPPRYTFRQPFFAEASIPSSIR
jgi:hypothetical protein